MYRPIIAMLALAALSACATGALNPPRPDGTELAGKTMHVVYAIRSVYEVVYARGYKGEAFTLNGTCSLTRGPRNIVTGCVISGGSASPYYTKSSFYLHNKTNGDGCTIAEGHFQGQTYAGQPIPIAFYWVQNSCYASRSST
jgi:hypothetical protein